MIDYLWNLSTFYHSIYHQLIKNPLGLNYIIIYLKLFFKKERKKTKGGGKKYKKDGDPRKLN